jgi:hypothetical protein
MKIYNVGDEVWCAWARIVKKERVCPDCLGQKYLTLIMGDGSEVSVDCENCKRGWRSPYGKVEYYEFAADVSYATIKKVEIEKDKIRYTFTDNYVCDSDKVFGLEKDARAKADELAKAKTEEKKRDMQQKDKPSHNWAWHASYHRRCIANAERDLAYHKKKLDVASRRTEKLNGQGEDK